MLWPKKNSYKEFDNELNSCASKIPLPPPITFLMVGPLIPFFLQTTFILPLYRHRNDPHHRNDDSVTKCADIL